MSAESVNIHIDGAARGNPGPAAFAFVIAAPGAEVVEDSGLLGNTTNNVAEYTALVRALDKAAVLKLDRLHIHSDSELLVKQMNGEYRVKNEDLRMLYDEGQALLRQFKSVRIQHVRREQNKRADELCNLVLDGGKRHPRAASKKSEKTSKVGADAVREECMLCLAAARNVWAAHDAGAPTPAQVWEQLWSILEEGGVLKKLAK
jgi:ribonuclease HI